METPAAKTPFGEYVLHDRIGTGGMAEIFLATQPGAHDRELVIKRILPTLSGDEQFVKMFVEEARLCSHLSHPNIVQVHDLGAFDSQYYIAMEYVHGRDLLKTLAGCAKQRIAFPTDLALFIITEVLKGLDYAHNLRDPEGHPMGIIHRDVSPSNVLLSFDGKVKLGDFGIAKASTRERTATGILKGKLGYMAPEQVTGRPIDHRADVFAVGILLYELLTGHRLFGGRNDLQVLERVRDAVIDPPPRHYRVDLSPELEAIVLKALSRDPKDRYQTTAEFHRALLDYTSKKGVGLHPRMLARFLHDLFLNEDTSNGRPGRASKIPAGAGDSVPPVLGRAVLTDLGRESVGGGAKNGQHRSLTNNERRPGSPSFRGRMPLSLIDASAKELGVNFYDEATDSPWENEEATNQSPEESAKIRALRPDRRRSANDADEATQETEMAGLGVGAPLPADPADRQRSLPQPRRVSADREALEGAARSARKGRNEDQETDEDRGKKNAPPPESFDHRVLTPYGGVPLRTGDLPFTRTTSTVDEGSPRGVLVQPAEPLETPDAGGATEQIDEDMVRLAFPVEGGDPEELDSDEVVETAADGTAAEIGTEQLPVGSIRELLSTVPHSGQRPGVVPQVDLESTLPRGDDPDALALGAALSLEQPAGLAESSQLSDGQMLSATAPQEALAGHLTARSVTEGTQPGIAETPSEPPEPPAEDEPPETPSLFRSVPSQIAREWHALLQEQSGRTEDELKAKGAAPSPEAHESADLPVARPKRRPSSKQISTRPVSVVGKVERRAVSRAPGPASNRDDSVPNEETRYGQLAPGAPATVPPPAAPKLVRQLSSGVTAALSEAREVDEEIRAIRELSQGSGEPVPDDETSNGVLLDETPSEARRPVALEPPPLPSTSSVAVTQEGGTGEREDWVDTVQGPEGLTPGPQEKPSGAGRLEDEGAADLFGALALIESGPLEIEEQFQRNNEDSLVTTGVGGSDERALVSEEMLQAPQTFAAQGALAAEKDISVSFDPTDEPTESLEEASARAPSNVARPVLAPSVVRQAESLEEGSTVDVTSDYDAKERSSEDLESTRDVIGDGGLNLQHEETAALLEQPIPRSSQPVAQLLSDRLDLATEDAADDHTPPPALKKRSSAPVPPATTSPAAERRLRALVERNRPVKEKRGAPTPSVDPTPMPAVEQGPISQPPPARAAVTTAPPPPARTKAPAFGQQPVTVEYGRPVLTTRRATMILVVVSAIAAVAIIMMHFLGGRRMAPPQPIPPVTESRTPPPPKRAPIERAPIERAAIEPPAQPPAAPARDEEPARAAPANRAAGAFRAPETAPPEPPPAQVKEPATKVKEPATKVEPKKVAPPPAKVAEPKPERTAPVERQPKVVAPEKPKKRANKRTPGVEIACGRPAQVTIRPGGSWSEVTQKFIPLSPGDYQLVLKPEGGKPQTFTLRILAEQQNVVRCNE